MRLEGRRMFSRWLRELFLTPWYKPSTLLPEHACGVWDSHQVWKGEAELQKMKFGTVIQAADFMILFSISGGHGFIDIPHNIFSWKKKYIPA